MKNKLSSFYKDLDIEINEVEISEQYVKNEHLEEYYKILSKTKKGNDITSTERLCLASQSYNRSTTWYNFNNHVNHCATQVIDLSESPPGSPKTEDSKRPDVATKVDPPQMGKELDEGKDIVSASTHGNEKSLEKNKDQEMSTGKDKGHMSTEAHSKNDACATATSSSSSTTLQLGRTNKRKNRGKNSFFSPSLKHPFEKKLKGSGVDDSSSSEFSSEVETNPWEETSDDESAGVSDYETNGETYDTFIGTYVGRPMFDRKKDLPITYNICECNYCGKISQHPHPSINRLESTLVLCEACQSNRNIPIETIDRLVSNTQDDIHTCISCNKVNRRGKNHMFGKASFCRLCIAKDKCYCPTCINVRSKRKPIHKTVMNLYQNANHPDDFIIFGNERHVMMSQLRLFFKVTTDLQWLYRLLSTNYSKEKDLSDSSQVVRVLDRSLTKYCL